MSFVAAKLQQNCTGTDNYNSKATRQGIICAIAAFNLRKNREKTIFKDIFKNKPMVDCFDENFGG